MNGFQLGFIESILEISSFHLRIEADKAETDENLLSEESEEQFEGKIQDVASAVLTVPGVVSAVPFRELRAILRGGRSSQEGALIRGLAPDALDRDAGMAEKLAVEDGAFDLRDERSIVLGAELAKRLYVRVGDRIKLVSLSGLFDSDDEAVFTITGIFRSYFYEYDLSWAFVNINTAAQLDDTSLILGVKLKNRWQDAHALSLIHNLPFSENTRATSWRSYNRAFFSALRSEKLLMFLLVGLIFIVVGLNIFQGQRRAVLERREEIGLLRALGADSYAVRLVFVWDGFIIGLAGAASGMALGLFLATHIRGFFNALEYAVNGVIGLLNTLFSVMGHGFLGKLGKFSIFSSDTFYLKEIPARVIPHEAALIFLFGFLSAVLSSWFASRRAARTEPAEVLRYE
jgi:lipoprotein-releasing system permease protein